MKENWREDAFNLFELATTLYWDKKSRVLGIVLPGPKAILRIHMDRVNDRDDVLAVEWGWRMHEDAESLWEEGSGNNG